MSLCTVCYIDSKKHSKKLWDKHSQMQRCTLCQKKSSEHSESLWEIHKLAVDRFRYCPEHHKQENLRPITLGFASKGIARVCELNADSPYDKELIPIYMSCTECNLHLGSTEEDYADILGKMCLKCFREQTEQTDSWYDIPPVLKGKQCVVCSINFFGRSDSDKCRECSNEKVLR